jgi:hypothetical protein
MFWYENKEIRQVPFDIVRNRVNEGLLKEIDPLFIHIGKNFWVKNIDEKTFQVFELLLEKGVRFCYYKYGIGFYNIPITKDFNDFHKIDFKKYGVEYHMFKSSLVGMGPKSGKDGLELMYYIEGFEESLKMFFRKNKKKLIKYYSETSTYEKSIKKLCIWMDENYLEAAITYSLYLAINGELEKSKENIKKYFNKNYDFPSIDENEKLCTHLIRIIEEYSKK